jgi:hypothetical protein
MGWRRPARRSRARRPLRTGLWEFIKSVPGAARKWLHDTVLQRSSTFGLDGEDVTIIRCLGSAQPPGPAGRAVRQPTSALAKLRGGQRQHRSRCPCRTSRSCAASRDPLRPCRRGSSSSTGAEVSPEPRRALRHRRTGRPRCAAHDQRDRPRRRVRARSAFGPATSRCPPPAWSRGGSGTSRRRWGPRWPS